MHQTAQIMTRFLPFLLILVMGVGCTSDEHDDEHDNEQDIKEEKPVIYLYPEEVMDVSVGLDFHGALTAVYPAYHDGWLVSASPSGELIDLKDQRAHEYLFYEGVCDDAVYSGYQFNEGFCVARADVVSFLESNLDEIGLNHREANDMITFWMARLMESNYVIIRFQLNEECNNIADLEITPKPDSELRIMMDFKNVDEPREIKPQIFKPFIRKGFTVIEWGGTDLTEHVTFS
jgi:hypothetical protein